MIMSRKTIAELSCGRLGRNLAPPTPTRNLAPPTPTRSCSDLEDEIFRLL